MASSEIPPPRSNHPEDIIIIWLDETLKNSDEIFSYNRKTLLLSYVKVIQLFVEDSTCLEYIEGITDARIIFIVSGSLGERIVPIVHDLSKLTYIYVFCADISRHEVWAAQFTKIRGVFNADFLLANKLKDDVYSLSNISFPFGLFDSTQRSLTDLTVEESSFMWCRLVTELFARLPDTIDSKAEMLADCRLKHKDNQVMLDQILKFEESYQKSDAIKWYTANSFVFKAFNEEFRKQNFKVIFKYRSFFLDLLNQISSLYNVQYKNKKNNLRVFRGQHMYKDELMKLKHNIGHIISINTFFSTSTCCSAASTFVSNGEHQSIGVESVMFQIEVDLNVPQRPYADVTSISSMKDECEIIFSIGSIFQIVNVDLENDTTWLVMLKWTKETNEKWIETSRLTNMLDFYVDQHIGECPSILTFGLFLSKMGRLSEAVSFYTEMRKILPSDHPDQGILHNNVGEVLRQLGFYERARNHFKRALEYCIDIMSIFHPIWIIIHSNMALLEVQSGHPKQALKFYNCILLLLARPGYVFADENIHKQHFLSTIYHGIGSVYYDLEQPKKGLHFCQKALEIELRILPEDHSTLIETYNELSVGNIMLSNHNKALEYYEECLRIAQKNLLNSDWKLVSIHTNIATLLSIVDKNQSKILSHCTKALQLAEQSTLPAHNIKRAEVYQILAKLYTSMNLKQLALDLWVRIIDINKNTMILNCTTNSSIWVELPDKILFSNNVLLYDRNSPFDPTYVERELIKQCEIADEWRLQEYLKPAMCYYIWLIENIPDSLDPYFIKVHKSRLHNNLAACYQDLDYDTKALDHYLQALNLLSPNEENKSIQAAITHYNIALIYMNLNELDEAEVHLNKSLSHFLGVSTNNGNRLDLLIYRSFAKIYERQNNWEKARDYYQCLIDRCKQDKDDRSTIEKYEKRLQYTIDKLNENL